MLPPKRPLIASADAPAIGHRVRPGCDGGVPAGVDAEDHGAAGRVERPAPAAGQGGRGGRRVAGIAPVELDVVDAPARERPGVLLDVTGAAGAARARP